MNHVPVQNQTHISGGEVDDLEAVLDDPHSHQLLAVVPPDDRAVNLAELLGGVASGRVQQVLGVLVLHHSTRLILRENKYQME